MTTDLLRQTTADACRRIRGTLWPNGLGFDRWGWEYMYSERLQLWTASKRLRYARVYGEGITPEAAKQAAAARETV